MKRAYLIIVMLLLASLAWGRSPGTSSGLFLTMPTDTKGAGMGEAYSAAARGVRGLWYNPATLSRDPQGSLTLTHTQYVEGISYNSFGIAAPFGSKNAVGLGGQFLRMEAIPGYDNVGTPMGSYAPQDVSLQMGYAKTIYKTSLGLSLKYLRSTIKDTATTLAWDVGFHQELERVSFGISEENMEGSLKYKNESTPLPKRTRLGISWTPDVRWLLNADLVCPKREDNWAAVGAEYRLFAGKPTMMALRAGYNTKYQDSLNGLYGLSAGAGITINKVEINYAWLPYGNFGTTHRFSIDMRFHSPFIKKDILAGSQQNPPASSSLKALSDALAYPRRPWRKAVLGSPVADTSIAALFASQSLCSQKGPQALLTGKGGIASIQSDSSPKRWPFSRKTQHLFEGDEIITKIGRAQLIFMNGSRLDVRANSRVRMVNNPEGCQGATALLEKGDIIVTTEKDKFFTVQTALGEIQLRSAEGRIRLNDGALTIELYQGNATFLEEGTSLVLAEGIVLKKIKGSPAPAITKMEGDAKPPEEVLSPVETGDLPSRWDPAAVENLHNTIRALLDIKGVEISEYIRDQKLRDAYELVISDLESSRTDIESQKMNYEEDLASFKILLEECAKPVNKETKEEKIARRKKCKELKRVSRSARVAGRTIEKQLNALNKDLCRFHEALAKLPLAQTVRITVHPSFLNYENKETAIPPKAEETLTRVAQLLPELKVQQMIVTGQADPSAPRFASSRLAKKRAQAAAKFLSDKSGLPASLINSSVRRPKEEIQENTRGIVFNEDRSIEIWLELKGL
ncbi:MAG: PorV/PorQ family protein [Elusimicrobia bacterium]|nr:PorV/PorQ family protein [Candidatus Obscuribacterium magneticum]